MKYGHGGLTYYRIGSLFALDLHCDRKYGTTVPTLIKRLCAALEDRRRRLIEQRDGGQFL